MLPEISIRSHSSDQFLLDRVLYSNSYRINNLLPNSTVVDIGANFGAFCINAQIRGAEKIYAFEPFQHNYEVLIKNLNQFCKNYRSYQLGVSNSSGFFPMSDPELINNAFYDTSNLKISESGNFSYFCKLDEALSIIPEKIHLLKISAPNVLEILENSSKLFLCDNLCFELENVSQSDSEDILSKVKKKGSFLDCEISRNSEKTTLYKFSKTDTNICFLKYNN